MLGLVSRRQCLYIKNKYYFYLVFINTCIKLSYFFCKDDFYLNFGNYYI